MLMKTPIMVSCTIQSVQYWKAENVCNIYCILLKICWFRWFIRCLWMRLRRLISIICFMPVHRIQLSSYKFHQNRFSVSGDYPWQTPYIQSYIASLLGLYSISVDRIREMAGLEPATFCIADGCLLPNSPHWTSRFLDYNIAFNLNKAGNSRSQTIYIRLTESRHIAWSNFKLMPFYYLWMRDKNLKSKIGRYCLASMKILVYFMIFCLDFW